MNLEKLLAENMIRFGVKNLNEDLRKTLLNEGYSPGDSVPNYVQSMEPAEGGDNSTKILPKIQTYPKGFVRGGAIAALAVGISNLIKKDKKIIKATDGGATVGEMFNIITTETTWFSEAWAQLIDPASAFTYEKTEVQVYPSLTLPDGVATIGVAQSQGGNIFQVVASNKQSGMNYNNLIRYFNSFNLANITDNDFTQYRLSDMVDTNNHINLLKVAPALNTVIVYTATANTPNVANKEVGATTVGASAPIDKIYDVSFAAGVATVPPNDAEVTTAVADAIAMFPDGNISNLTIVSSASPEFNSKQGGPATIADYGTTPITGTGQPNVGNDNIGRNIKLAYDRGVNFVNAINAGLVAQGKPEITNPTINWQISDKGGKLVAGRYANVLWSKAGSPGKEVGNLKNTGTTGNVTQGKETFTIFQHVFTCIS